MLKPDVKASLPGTQNVHRTRLDNGLTVLVYENHNVQSAVVTGSLRAGAIYEDPTQGGLASMTAGALLRGTQNRTFDQINTELEDIGADLDYSTGKFKVGFNGKALAEDLPVLLDILADSLRYPVFPAAQIDRMRGERITWMQYQQQDTRWQADRLFRQTLYPTGHPFHYTTVGTVNTVQSLQTVDLAAFHARQYGPADMILVVVGAVDSDTALDLVKSTLGDWENPAQLPRPALTPLTPRTALERVQTTLPGKTQADLVMGVAGPARYAADYRAAVLVNSVLGQFGMMGRIGDVVREREGMAYYAYSSVDGGFGPGAWRVSAGVNPANIDRAITLINQEVQRIIDTPVDADDLADNQSYFIGRLPLQLETSEGVANTLHTIETYDLGLDYLTTYKREISALTVDDLQAAAAHYLDPQRMVIAVAGPDV